jgi:anti-sigma factor ChrR (cupin superfamily)
MPVASVCPDASTLQRFAVGQMPPAEVEQLAKHCEQCERCIRLLHTFNAEDTLTEAMAVQSTAPDQARDAAVAALIHRLSSLPSPLPTETSSTVA